MERHSYSFFGQKVGMLLDSGNHSEPSIYIKFLRKKTNGDWEKPSLGEGKSIKLNLLEIISIRNILLEHGNSRWSTVHKFGRETTPITIIYENKNLIFQLPGYMKSLRGPEAILFKDLLEHIYKEKIEFATGRTQREFYKTYETENLKNYSQNNHNGYSNSQSVPPNARAISPESHSSRNQSQQIKSTKNSTNNSNDSNDFNDFNDFNDIYDDNGFDKVGLDYIKESPNPPPFGKDSNKNYKPNIEIPNKPNLNERELWLKTLDKDDEFYFVPAELVTKTPKAMAIQIGTQSLWIPRSVVKGNGVPILNNSQNGFWIKKWFIEKKAEEIIP